MDSATSRIAGADGTRPPLRGTRPGRRRRRRPLTRPNPTRTCVTAAHASVYGAPTCRFPRPITAPKPQATKLADPGQGTSDLTTMPPDPPFARRAATGELVARDVEHSWGREKSAGKKAPCRHPCSHGDGGRPVAGTLWRWRGGGSRPGGGLAAPRRPKGTTRGCFAHRVRSDLLILN